MVKVIQIDFQNIVGHSVSSAQQGATMGEPPADNSETPCWSEIQIGDSGKECFRWCDGTVVAFTQHPSDFGKAESMYHHIPTGTNPPIKERHQPLPPALYQPVRNMIMEMKEASVIRESHSPWAAPLKIVKKQHGSLRFCVDYRKLNSVMHKDACPLPRIEESLTALEMATYFTLDLTSGYWQIPMAGWTGRKLPS